MKSNYSPIRNALIWCVIIVACVAPIIAATQSPLLAWRGPIYISASFAGIVAMVFLLLQPFLAGNYLPGLSKQKSHFIHRFVGLGLLVAVVIHVAGLWITSAPDVIDALLFRSPTPFSAWGVIAMWTIFATGLLAVFRMRLHLRPRIWRFAHVFLAAITIFGAVVHALLIEGTMETLSKVGLCIFVVLVTLKVIVDLRVLAILKRRGG